MHFFLGNINCLTTIQQELANVLVAKVKNAHKFNLLYPGIGFEVNKYSDFVITATPPSVASAVEWLLKWRNSKIVLQDQLVYESALIALSDPACKTLCIITDLVTPKLEHFLQEITKRKENRRIYLIFISEENSNFVGRVGQGAPHAERWIMLRDTWQTIAHSCTCIVMSEGGVILNTLSLWSPQLELLNKTQAMAAIEKPGGGNTVLHDPQRYANCSFRATDGKQTEIEKKMLSVGQLVLARRRDTGFFYLGIISDMVLILLAWQLIIYMDLEKFNIVFLIFVNRIVFIIYLLCTQIANYTSYCNTYVCCKLNIYRF